MKEMHCKTCNVRLTKRNKTGYCEKHYRKSIEYKNKESNRRKSDRLKNPLKWKKIYQKNYQNRAEQERENSRKRRYILRYLALEHYSNGLIECACCGENNQIFLTIDHINNDGNNHRKQISSGGLYQWLKSHNYPKGFQVLCYNCNMVKGHYGMCVHIKKEGKRDI